MYHSFNFSTALSKSDMAATSVVYHVKSLDTNRDTDLLLDFELCITPDAQYVLTGSDDGTAKLFPMLIVEDDDDVSGKISSSERKKKNNLDVILPKRGIFLRRDRRRHALRNHPDRRFHGGQQTKSETDETSRHGARDRANGSLGEPNRARKCEHHQRETEGRTRRADAFVGHFEEREGEK